MSDKAKLPYTEDELLNGLTPENAHADLVPDNLEFEAKVKRAQRDNPDLTEEFIRSVFKAKDEPITEYVFESGTTAHAYEVTLYTVRNIFYEWNLTTAEQEAFLGESASLIRLSRILNIYRLLRTQWEPHRTASWLRVENDHFDGKSALEVILDSKTGLETVQHYLNMHDESSWDEWFNQSPGVSDDFLSDREQPGDDEQN